MGEVFNPAKVLGKDLAPNTEVNTRFLPCDAPA